MPGMTHRLLLAALTLLAAAAPAQAEVVVHGTGEPAFTSSRNNTQWVQWSNNGNYRIEFHHHVNGGNPVVDGPYQVARTGTTSVNWDGIRGTTIPLQEGSTYTICGFGRWDDGTGMYFPDFSTSCGDADRRGLRASTTIDRTAPTATATLGAGAAAVRSAAVGLRIAFTDDLAGPFPANFLCVQHGAASGPVCDSGKGYRYVEQPACSQPLTASRTSTAFECTIDMASAPDGEVWTCVMAADASIPDNPTSADQRAPATAANRSAPNCDGVLLDRVAPSVTIGAPASVTAGDLVPFTTEASDATSGLTGRFEWTWGDGTAPGSGASATHTFTQPGTYEVVVRTADAAGNPATAKRVVTVQPRPATGGGETPSGGGAPAGGGGSPAGGGGVPAGGGSPAGDVAGDSDADEGGLDVDVSAPRAVSRARARRGLRLTLDTSDAGTARLALLRAGRVVAQATRRVAEGESRHTLRLPRGLGNGAYRLRVVLTTAAGESRTASVAVRVGPAPRARSASAAAAAPGVTGTSGPTLPDGRFHGTAPRRFTPDLR